MTRASAPSLRNTGTPKCSTKRWRWAGAGMAMRTDSSQCDPTGGALDQLVDGRQHHLAHVAQLARLGFRDVHDHAQVGFGAELVQAQRHPGRQQLDGPNRPTPAAHGCWNRRRQRHRTGRALEHEVLAQREGKVVTARPLDTQGEGLEQVERRHTQLSVRIVLVDPQFSQNRVDREAANGCGLAPASQTTERARTMWTRSVA